MKIILSIIIFIMQANHINIKAFNRIYIKIQKNNRRSKTYDLKYNVFCGYNRNIFCRRLELKIIRNNRSLKNNIEKQFNLQSNMRLNLNTNNSKTLGRLHRNLIKEKNSCNSHRIKSKLKINIRQIEDKWLSNNIPNIKNNKRLKALSNHKNNGIPRNQLQRKKEININNMTNKNENNTNQIKNKQIKKRSNLNNDKNTKNIKTVKVQQDPKVQRSVQQNKDLKKENKHSNIHNTPKNSNISNSDSKNLESKTNKKNLNSNEQRFNKTKKTLDKKSKKNKNVASNPNIESKGPKPIDLSNSLSGSAR